MCRAITIDRISSTSRSGPALTPIRLPSADTDMRQLGVPFSVLGHHLPYVARPPTAVRYIRLSSDIRRWPS